MPIDETIPDGCYLSADGKTYHDAHGNVISVEMPTPITTPLPMQEPVSDAASPLPTSPAPAAIPPKKKK